MKKQKVLHVLTLIEGRGEYGGPVTVARTFQHASYKSRYELQLIGGTREPTHSRSSWIPADHRILVKPILKKHQISSLISLKAISELFRRIHSSNIVHLHFARDVIQIIAGLICIVSRKPFFIQTHGMIRKKESWIVELFDRVAIIPILKRAHINFALSDNEAIDLKEVYPKIRISILRNGYDFGELLAPIPANSSKINIIFCSRLHVTKGINHFCELAKEFENNDAYRFTIFGPDGGELAWIEKFISENNLINLKYSGALPPDRVIETLAASDLLILPSNYDPYPMVVLEALSVGTPVLISSVCGQASEIEKTDPNFVYKGEKSESLIRAFHLREPIKVDVVARARIRNSYHEIFGIDSVWKTLEGFYEGS